MLSAIIVAAGRSSRFKGKLSKVLLEINSKPVIYYSLRALEKYPDVKEIIVVASPKNIKEISRIISRYKIKKVKKIVLGGRERQDSVSNGLNSLSPDCDFVLIHDGARPFINKHLISSSFAAAKRCGAAVIGVPVKATVKRAGTNFWVKETVERDGLWEIQTPQVFKKGLILKAHKKAARLKVTDDSMLVERLGAKVKIVLGSYDNIKITNPEDLLIAEYSARKYKCA
jgi:2-C-methyl-D-erythritol 4-phosphate cytidylyltransferase